MEKHTGNRTSLMIRRFVAIVLTLLSVGALFWPSAIALGGALRRETREWVDQTETDLEKIEESEFYYVRDYCEPDQEGSEIANRMHARILAIIEENKNTEDEELKEAYTDAGELYDILFGNLAPIGIRQGFFEKVYDAIKDLGVSFFEVRNIVSDVPYFLEKASDRALIESEGDVDGVLVVRLFVYGYNVLFFLVIALAAAAVIMMALNRIKVFSILYAIFAVLFGGAFIALWVFALLKGNHMLLPGVGAFALPILAIAACIVYKRDKSYKGVFPKRERKVRVEPAPAFEPEPFDPRGNQYVKKAPAPFDIPAPVAEGWQCPVCQGINELSAKYCTFCGTVRPEPEPEPEPEPMYEIPAEPEQKMLRCPNCGEEMELGMRFCTKCGTKIQ